MAYHNDKKAEIFKVLAAIKELNSRRNEFIHALADAENGIARGISKGQEIEINTDKFKTLYQDICKVIGDLNTLHLSLNKNSSILGTRETIICEVSAAPSIKISIRK